MHHGRDTSVREGLEGHSMILDQCLGNNTRWHGYES